METSQPAALRRCFIAFFAAIVLAACAIIVIPQYACAKAGASETGDTAQVTNAETKASATSNKAQSALEEDIVQATNIKTKAATADDKTQNSSEDQGSSLNQGKIKTQDTTEAQNTSSDVKKTSDSSAPSKPAPETNLTTQADQPITEVTLASGDRYEVNLAAGQELIANFKLNSTALVGLAYYQTLNSTSGTSVQSSLLKANGNQIQKWDISASLKETASFGPIWLSAGNYKYRLVALSDVTIKVAVAIAETGGNELHENEPNDTVATATKMELEKPYAGTVYDPNGEVDLLGSMQGMMDTDLYSFTIQEKSKVNAILISNGAMSYELTRNPSEKSILLGSTDSGKQTTNIDCGILEAGTYYFMLNCNPKDSKVWKSTYAFSVTANPVRITRIELSQKEYVYNGEWCRPTVSVWAGKQLLASGLDIGDYSKYVTISGNRYAENAGTYKVTVQGKGDYSGSLETSFVIKPKQITSITLDQTKFEVYAYTKAPQYPTVYVYAGTEKVGTYYSFSAGDEDVSVDFPSNAGPVGTYTITVRGRGNYTGTHKATYKIYDPSASTSSTSTKPSITTPINSKTKSPTTAPAVTGTWKVMPGGLRFNLDTKSKKIVGGSKSYPANMWVKIAGKRYHFDSKGYMQTGWQKISGSRYYFNSLGAMTTGWQKIGKSWYYMGSDGKMKIGWATIGKKKYYLNASGVMATGWKKISGKWYYFAGSGAMQKSKWIGNYWVGSNGTMATNTWVDGNRYKVDGNGKWIPGAKK